MIKNINITKINLQKASSVLMLSGIALQIIAMVILLK